MLQSWTATLPEEAHAAVLELVERNPTPAALEALLTCAKLLSNVAQDPAKYGCLPCKARVLQERLLSRDGGEAAVIALGFDADLGAGSFIWTAPAEPREVACRAAAIRAAHDICVAVREDVVAVGNANAPRRAQDAISLCCTYVSNCLASDEARFRRISAANKALCGRLLAASGGGMLLRAVGFAPEPVSSPIAFVCTHDAPTLRLVLATLNNAPAIWQALADEFAAASASSSAGPSPPPVRQSSAAPGPMQGVWGATFIALEARHGGGDKVLLPPSALEAIGVLTEARHGTTQLPNPLCLRVECSDGRGTLGHGQPRRAAGRGQGGGGRLAGLLEFTAAEGHVALPRWLLQAVGAQEGVPLMLSSVDVPRASLVRLRPARTRFYEEVEDQQSLLQAGLHGVYTVLCCGETIRIANCGEEFELLVSEVCTGIPPTPVEAVCIVDVEALEVDMGESLEGEEERIAQERRAEETARAAQAAAQAAAAQAAAQAAAAEAEAARAAEAAAAHQAELAAWLPAEPQAAARGTVRVLVRLPTMRISRRFESGATLQQVRTWVESALPETLHGALGDRFELVSTHPRYVSRAGEGGETTLEMAGLDEEQAMLNLRLLE